MSNIYATDGRVRLIERMMRESVTASSIAAETDSWEICGSDETGDAR
jgi:hypothetical protein